MRAQRGLTLIELLVAVAIVAVMFGAISLSVNAVGGARVLEREARRFEALVGLACERAEITGRDVGIHVAHDSYGFSVARIDGWKLEGEGDLVPRTLASGTTLTLQRDDSEVALEKTLPDEPQAACFASGELTPFVARFDAGPSLAPLRLQAELDGTLKISAEAAP